MRRERKEILGFLAVLATIFLICLFAGGASAADWTPVLLTDNGFATGTGDKAPPAPPVPPVPPVNPSTEPAAPATTPASMTISGNTGQIMIGSPSGSIPVPPQTPRADAAPAGQTTAVALNSPLPPIHVAAGFATATTTAQPPRLLVGVAWQRFAGSVRYLFTGGNAVLVPTSYVQAVAPAQAHVLVHTGSTTVTTTQHSYQPFAAPAAAPMQAAPQQPEAYASPQQAPRKGFGLFR